MAGDFSPLLQDELATAAAAAESLQLAKVAVSSNPVVVTTALKWCSRSSVTLRRAGHPLPGSRISALLQPSVLTLPFAGRSQ